MALLVHSSKLHSRNPCRFVRGSDILEYELSASEDHQIINSHKVTLKKNQLLLVGAVYFKAALPLMRQGRRNVVQVSKRLTRHCESPRTKRHCLGLINAQTLIPVSKGLPLRSL